MHSAFPLLGHQPIQSPHLICLKARGTGTVPKEGVVHLPHWVRDSLTAEPGRAPPGKATIVTC